MKKYRSFDEEFKRDLVAQIDSGAITKAQAAREHTLSSTLIDRWQSQIHEGSLRPRPSLRERQLERELTMYKKKVGELSVQVDLLKKEALLLIEWVKTTGGIRCGWRPMRPRSSRHFLSSDKNWNTFITIRLIHAGSFAKSRKTTRIQAPRIIFWESRGRLKSQS